MRVGSVIVLCGVLAGCGLVAAPFFVELVLTSEGFVAEQREGDARVEVRFLGEPPRWKRTAGGDIQLSSETVMALRIPALTMFRALLQVRSTGGYRLFLRTTPREWQQRQGAPMELTVSSGLVLVRTASWSDTLEAPGEGSHRWELTQLEHGVWLRLECLPRRWLPLREPMTEWLLLQPLPGTILTLEGVSIREAVSLVQHAGVNK
ncbi:MAG: hypothetical protein NZ473_01700 [Candidatus Kapabacteria bacterium]|nr:hypothetical protein [Candidatus Kapabacteria bacterium]MDW7996076.1 hypothetical protein [Bacteroidota bacterium]MDW8225295.1 hypothetical protein [Bacteroidota bacterium]